MALLTKKIGKYSGFEKRKFPFVYLFIAFPVIQFIIFWVYVNFSSIVLAFQDGQGLFTLENFKAVLNAFSAESTVGGIRVNLFMALKHSLLLWGLDFFILFPIGVATTYVLYRRLLGHYVFRICYIIPSLMGAVMWTQLIRYLVRTDGAITLLFKAIGVSVPERTGLFSDPTTAFPTIVAIKIAMGLVGNNAVLTGAFSRVPDEIYESADLDGAGFWTTFFRIAVPCVWSTIATLLTFALCSFVTADYNVFLFTGGNGGNNTETIGYVLYKMTLTISESTGKPFYGQPAALGLLLTAITLPIVLFGRRIIDKVYADVEI